MRSSGRAFKPKVEGSNPTPPPAQLFAFNFGPEPLRQSPADSHDIANRLANGLAIRSLDPNSGAAVFQTAAVPSIREHRPCSPSLSGSRQASTAAGATKTCFLVSGEARNLDDASARKELVPNSRRQVRGQRPLGRESAGTRHVPFERP
jgi:hypothetical protein